MQKVGAKHNKEKDVKRHVIQALREVLSDPDAGLAISASFGKRLRASVRSVGQHRTRDLRAFLKRA